MTEREARFLAWSLSRNEGNPYSAFRSLLCGDFYVRASTGKEHKLPGFLVRFVP